jgi:hypothetical protein
VCRKFLQPFEKPLSRASWIDLMATKKRKAETRSRSPSPAAKKAKAEELEVIIGPADAWRAVCCVAAMPVSTLAASVVSSCLRCGLDPANDPFSNLGLRRKTTPLTTTRAQVLAAL